MGPVPDMRVDRVGWGFGDARFPDRPNALRLVLGESETPSAQCVVIETNVDDTTPELAGFLLERLFETGAKDVVNPDTHEKKPTWLCRVGVI